MSEKKSFLNWVGFSGEETATPGSVDRIRELEQQLADLRSRRDITSLSKEEFEILATGPAMSMIKSAQLRDARAQAASPYSRPRTRYRPRTWPRGYRRCPGGPGPWP